MYKKLIDIRTGRHREDAICRVADNTTIPRDMGNRDWQEYQEWLNAGNVPEEQ